MMSSDELVRFSTSCVELATLRRRVAALAPFIDFARSSPSVSSLNAFIYEILFLDKNAWYIYRFAVAMIKVKLVF